MKNVKKILIAVMAIVLTVGCVCAFAACNSNNTAEAKVKVIDIPLTAESYAFCIKKGDPKGIKPVADALLAELKTSGELDTIINSFFDGTATFEYDNPASPEGCFVVATNAYFPPFEYYNGKKLTGVDMKIASLLAAKFNKTLYILDEDFDSIFTSVDTGEADIAMAGITVNAARLESYDFTTEYYESAQVLVVKADDTTFDACKTAEEIEAVFKAKNKQYTIGTQNGTTGYMYCAGNEDFGYDGFTNLTTNGYKTGALAVQDIVSGVVNAVVIDKQPAIMIAKNINK